MSKLSPPNVGDVLKELETIANEIEAKAYRSNIYVSHDLIGWVSRLREVRTSLKKLSTDIKD